MSDRIPLPTLADVERSAHSDYRTADKVLQAWIRRAVDAEELWKFTSPGLKEPSPEQAKQLADLSPEPVQPHSPEGRALDGRQPDSGDFLSSD